VRLRGSLASNVEELGDEQQQDEEVKANPVTYRDNAMHDYWDATLPNGSVHRVEPDKGLLAIENHGKDRIDGDCNEDPEN
jgi:hypothetical protein